MKQFLQERVVYTCSDLHCDTLARYFDLIFVGRGGIEFIAALGSLSIVDEPRRGITKRTVDWFFDLPLSSDVYTGEYPHSPRQN
jgi:hypothetical protein